MTEEVKTVVKSSPIKLFLTIVGGVFMVIVVAVISGGSVWFVKNNQVSEYKEKYDKVTDEKEECLNDLDLLSDDCVCPKCKCEICECEVCECRYSTALVLPQVNYMAKLYYTEQDLDDLQEKVIDPIVEYYEDLGQTVVSIDIDNDNRGGAIKNEFIISVIISDNDGNSDPIYMGFIHFRVDGEIPQWEPITM